MSDPTLEEKSLILARLLTLRKGQITRECNKLRPLLAKFRQEKQDDSGLVPSSAQAAMKCVNLLCRYSDDYFHCMFVQYTYKRNTCHCNCTFIQIL